LFDPASLPDLLSELLISDEANKRAVSAQVVQRTTDGIVRGIATPPADTMPRGATVLNTGRQTATPVHQIGSERMAPLLAARASAKDGQNKLIETGIKVIDVMCPLIAGGTVALAGEYGAGLTAVMEEPVRRLSGGADPVSLFVLMPSFSPQWPGSLQPQYSIAGALKQDGYSEGTVGSVQTFFLRGQEEPWTADRLSAFAAADRLRFEQPRPGSLQVDRGIDLRFGDMARQMDHDVGAPMSLSPRRSAFAATSSKAGMTICLRQRSTSPAVSRRSGSRRPGDPRRVPS
jgi:hypothetical protein